MPYADPEKQRAYQQAYQRRWCRVRAARWKAAGACARCGEPVKRFAHCLACRRMLAENEARRRRTAMRPCVRCGQPAKSGAWSQTGQCGRCQRIAANAARWSAVRRKAA